MLEFEGQNLDAYEGLLVSMEANARRLNLLIGVCNDSQYRDELIEQYESEIEEGIVCYRITLQREKPSIRFLLEDLIRQNPEITAQERVVVTVLGADKLRFLELEAGIKSEVEEFAGYMQWTREGLRRFPFSIVIWVTTNVETVLKDKAKDFWSWRKGVFRFETKPREFVRKADLGSVQEVFGKNFQAESTSLIPIDDLKELIENIEAKDPKDSRLPSLYDALGQSYIGRLDQGEYRDYQQEAQRAIDCFQKALAFPQDKPTDKAYRLNALGYIHQDLGEYAKTEDFYCRALAIYKKEFGESHPSVASSLNNLANLYYNQGKYEAAEPLYIEALQMRKELLGDRHPSVADSLNNLALLYYSQGKYEAAEPLLIEALQMSQELLGDRHPSVATSLNNLALLYDNQGKYEAAEPLYIEALQMWKKLLGDRHPDVALSMNNLAALYDSQGKYEAAEPLYIDALQMRKELLGDRHPSVATSLNNLAWLYRTQEKYQKAMSLYEQALDILLEVLGADHPSTKDVMKSIEIVREKMSE